MEAYAASVLLGSAAAMVQLMQLAKFGAHCAMAGWGTAAFSIALHHGRYWWSSLHQPDKLETCGIYTWSQHMGALSLAPLCGDVQYPGWIHTFNPS